MESQLVQNLRYKLQKRVRRLNSVDVKLLVPALRQFWIFFDGNETFSGIYDAVMATSSDADKTVDRIFQGEGLVGETEEEAAAVGGLILRRLAMEVDARGYVLNLARAYGFGSSLSEAIEGIRDVFLEPFYEYVDEQLDDQQAILALLRRYKHRSEWFHRDRLRTLAEKHQRKCEAHLALDLYSFLYDQGLDFHIEPSSLSGEVDLIAAQDSDDPLLADAKVFDGDGRGKAYIRKAFNQVYTYTQQFNEPFGYLIIYRLTDIDLNLALSLGRGGTPLLAYNHKTIFFLTIDLHSHPKPVSKRDPVRAIEITEEEFVGAVAKQTVESV